MAADLHSKLVFEKKNEEENLLFHKNKKADVKRFRICFPE
jgi:hypothetical protein